MIKKVILEISREFEWQIEKEIHELELQYPLEIVGQKEKWNILRKNGDGTSQCECPRCKNTYNFSIHTFRNFNYCPNCGCQTEGAE